MGDAMVTARMPQAKKDAGNRVLEQLGSSASRFINSAYDYLIQHGTSPFAAETAQTPGLSAERLSEALSQIEAMSLPPDNRFRTMTDDDIRHERLARQGFERR